MHRLSGHGRSTCSGSETELHQFKGPPRGHANWSPTLSNRSLPSAVGNGFRGPETGGAETPKRRASARSETHNPRTPSPKSLKGPTFLHSAIETQTTQSAWWCRQSSANLSPQRIPCKPAFCREFSRRHGNCHSFPREVPTVCQALAPSIPYAWEQGIFVGEQGKSPR